MNEIKMRKKQIKKAAREANPVQRKLLYTAAILLIVLIVCVVFISTYEGGSLLRVTHVFPNKYIKQTVTQPDARDYPGNITIKLENKLRTLSDNTPIKIYIGHKGNFFNLVPVELSKKDILNMANSDHTLSFDLAD